MNPPSIRIGGKPASLGKRIGKGGEGEVYLLASDPSKALKIYFKPDRSRLDKVAAIVQAGLAMRTKLVSFPIEIATDVRGDFVGFTMNVVGNSKPLYELYSPKARKQNFPRADYRFLVHTARNLASAVAAVHDSGCVIGDINHSGFLISEQALVAIIDADSFQVNRDGKSYLCRVGVPEYTPPELQGRSLDGIVRTANHDAFGLAVAIFQLLFLGKHPFAGMYSGTEEMPLEKAILEGRYAYSTRRTTGMAPPPHGPKPSMMPPVVALAFEQAFTRDPGVRRPTAVEWISHLNAVEFSLIQCGAHKEHYFPKHAGSCPWCAMDNQFGTTVFPPIFVPPSTVSVGDFNVDQVWASIDCIVLPDPKTIVPLLPSTSPAPSAAAKEAVNARHLNHGVGIVAIGAGAVLLFYLPAIFFISIALAVYGFKRFNSSPEAVERVRRSVESSRASLVLELKAFHQKAGSLEPARLKSELATARHDYGELPKTQAHWHQQYQDSRRQLQLSDFLDRFRVDKEKITSINRGLAQTLVAYGYETAEDINDQVTRVPGIGQVRRQRLLDWKSGLERRFVFNPNPTPLDQVERHKIDSKVAQMRSDLQKRLSSGADQLRDAVRRIESTTRNPHSTLIEAYKNYQASVADARHVGISISEVALSPPDTLIPTSTNSPSYAVTSISPVTPQRSTRLPAAAIFNQPTCPKCGTVMRRKVASRGRHAGKAFWGCPRYPKCDGIRTIP